VTVVRVVAAREAADRQRLLDRWVRDTETRSRAVIVESGFGTLLGPDDVPVVRLLSGCVCCVGTVALRVALVRLLRISRPEDLLLILSDDAHLDRVRSLLADGTLGVRLAVDG
jgi:G3E family GTPase